MPSTHVIEVPGWDCGAGGSGKRIGGAQKLVEVVGPEVVPDEAEDCDPDVGLRIIQDARQSDPTYQLLMPAFTISYSRQSCG